MKRSVACIGSVVLCGICNLPLVFAGTFSGTCLTSRDDGYDAITAPHATMLVEGEGRTGDSTRYGGNLPGGEGSDLHALVLPDVEPAERRMSDHELQRDIERELTWSPSVESNHVEVTVNDGVAYLDGTVEDWSEMEAAIRNAYEAGANEVENRMIIKSPRE